jgi:hypothetical protein
MATIVTRAGKGSPLTHNEVDANFTNLNSDKIGSGDTVASLTLTAVDVADKITHTGDTNTAIRFPAADTVTVETAGSERVRVDSSGNVGIGTSSPSEKLDVSGNVTISGSVILNGSTISAIQVTIADDAVAELTFTNRRFGMLSVVEGSDDDSFPVNGGSFLGYVDFGNTPSGSAIYTGSLTDLDNTNTLTGTTGADGQITIGTAGTSGTLYLENREGSTRTFNVTLL